MPLTHLSSCPARDCRKEERALRKAAGIGGFADMAQMLQARWGGMNFIHALGRLEGCSPRSVDPIVMQRELCM